MKIEPPVSPANLEKIHDLIKQAAVAELPAAGVWFPELRCCWVGHVVAGECVGWFMAPAATSEHGKKFASLWSTFWQDVGKDCEADAAVMALACIDAARKKF